MAPDLRRLFPGGVDKVLELVGTETLNDSLQCIRPGGIVCMTGILGNRWTMDAFTPMGDIPSLGYLTVYMGEASDLTGERLQDFIDLVTAGILRLNIDRTFRLEQIAEAHRDMEANQATGKTAVEVWLCFGYE